METAIYSWEQERKDRIRHLDFIIGEIKKTAYPANYEESRITMLSALEERKQSIIEGRV